MIDSTYYLKIYEHCGYGLLMKKLTLLYNINLYIL